MKNKIKNMLFIISLIFTIVLLSNVSQAHPGKLDSNNGHYCRTNCERWGLKYGEYHKHTKDGGYYNSKGQRFTKDGKLVNSELIKNSWSKVGESWYYLNENGEKVTGWEKVSGKWYYLKSTGEMATGWEEVSGKWYYLKSTGEMATGWEEVSGKWYYLKSTGEMATGWEEVSGKWYYLKSTGKMATGWEEVSGKWYYLKSTGEMATGWEKVSGKWYYLKSTGEMATGWEEVSGYWYFLDRTNGDMKTGIFYADGKKYQADSSGRYLRVEESKIPEPGNQTPTITFGDITWPMTQVHSQAELDNLGGELGVTTNIEGKVHGDGRVIHGVNHADTWVGTFHDGINSIKIKDTRGETRTYVLIKKRLNLPFKQLVKEKRELVHNGGDLVIIQTCMPDSYDGQREALWVYKMQ